MRIISYEEAGKQVKIGEEEERDKGGNVSLYFGRP